MYDVKQNLRQVLGDLPEGVRLVAISKYHPNEYIMAAYEEGQRIFGESHEQELRQKVESLPRDIEWHFIGHLQTNKAKNIVGRVCLIHSVDSMHLAEEIDRRAASASIVQEVLLQVNAAGEETKFGLAEKDVLPLAEAIAADLDNVRIRGLMQIPPFEEEPDKVRVWFKKLYSLKEDLQRRGFRDADILSMGMSHDFETAIEEGANIIRVGTSIFGERDYTRKMGGE